MPRCMSIFNLTDLKRPFQIRMAENPSTVENFLRDLANRLQALRETEEKELVKLKVEEETAARLKLTKEEVKTQRSDLPRYNDRERQNNKDNDTGDNLL